MRRRRQLRQLALLGAGLGGVIVGTYGLRWMLGLRCQLIDKEPLEPLAPMQASTGCDPYPKPGVERFRDFVLRNWGGGDGGIINRACGQTGHSDHDTGRAWDWKILPGWTTDGRFTEPDMDGLLGWLLAPDCHGRGPAAMARRAGLMYVLWLDKGWRSQASPLAPAATIYTIPSSMPPHLNHVHFSFSIAGAAGETSLYRAI